MFAALTFVGSLHFCFLMVMLRPQGSIHKVVPFGNGARARIDVSCTSGALSEFQEKMRGVARAEIVKEGQLKVEKEAGGGWWKLKGRRCFGLCCQCRKDLSFGSVVWCPSYTRGCESTMDVCREVSTFLKMSAPSTIMVMLPSF